VLGTIVLYETIHIFTHLELRIKRFAF